MSHSSATELPSNRSFGCWVGSIFLLISLMPYIRRGESPRLWLMVPALLLLLLGLIWPSVLTWPNRWWMKIAHGIAAITNPIISGLIFFLVFTPTALMFRLIGKDPMRRGFDPNATTYWIDRGNDDGRGGMEQQF